MEEMDLLFESLTSCHDLVCNRVWQIREEVEDFSTLERHVQQLMLEFVVFEVVEHLARSDSGCVVSFVVS